MVQLLKTKDQRQPLISLLKRYKPINSGDMAQARRIMDFVQTDENCFERSNLKGHITGSAWLVDASGERVLLTHHKKLNHWLQLGGHADGNPNILEVALREAREESGLKQIQRMSNEIFDLDVHPIPRVAKEPSHIHYDLRFVFKAPGTENISISPESHRLAWVEVRRLSDYSTEDSLLRMGRKWIKRLRGITAAGPRLLYGWKMRD